MKTIIRKLGEYINNNYDPFAEKLYYFLANIYYR